MRTLDELTWPVTTDRLSIRRLSPDDADASFAHRSRPEVSQWLGRHLRERAAYGEHFESRLGTSLGFETLAEPGALIGDLYVQLTDPWAQAEVASQAVGTQATIGWTLAPEAQGQGFATEAVRALLGICFDGLGVRRVVAECFAANEPSWRLMERLGMRREQHNVQASLHRDLGWLDDLSYAMLADEWRSSRST